MSSGIEIRIVLTQQGLLLFHFFSSLRWLIVMRGLDMRRSTQLQNPECERKMRGIKYRWSRRFKSSNSVTVIVLLEYRSCSLEKSSVTGWTLKSIRFISKPSRCKGLSAGMWLTQQPRLQISACSSALSSFFTPQLHFMQTTANQRSHSCCLEDSRNLYERILPLASGRRDGDHARLIEKVYRSESISLEGRTLSPLANGR